jgi:Family of unknown function (DUF6445)
MKHYPATIVDDFFADPDSVREFALSQTFKLNSEIEDPSVALYPGLRTDDLYNLDIGLFNVMCNQIFSLFHNFSPESAESLNWTVRSQFQLISNDWEDGWIHMDDDTVFAGVIYLTPDAPKAGGTSLYKKNSLYNFERYQELQKSKHTFYRNRIKTEQYIKDKKEANAMFYETVNVSNIYNRLVIFDGEEYHGANQFFGTNSQDSRLLLSFFVNRVSLLNTEPPIIRMKS